MVETSILFLREGITSTEHQAGLKVSMDKASIKIDDEKGVVSGKPAKGHGQEYEPWFSFTDGLAGCTCSPIAEGDVTYCRHIVGLFRALTKRQEKYAEQFVETRNNNPLFSSYKTQSESISTGSEAFDDMIGGGWPRGVVTLFTGPTKIGKTTTLTASAFKTAFEGLNVLFVDTENMIRRKQALLHAQKLFAARFGHEIEDEEAIHPNIHPLPQHNLYDVAKIFGVYIYVPKGTDRKLIPIIKKEYNKYSDIPAYKICKSLNIDLVILDGLTELFKSGGITTSSSQNLIGRGEIINLLYESFEGIAGELDVAFVMTSHVSRDNRYFNIYDDILDKKVTERNAGVWGGSSLMYNVKYFVQLEKCTQDWAKGRDIIHAMRRLWPYMRPTHVDLEFIDDWGIDDIKY